VVPVHEAVSEATFTEVHALTGQRELRALCTARGVAVAPDLTAGELVQRLFEEVVIPVTTAPTFFTDVPIDAAPLAHARRDAPVLADRTDLVAMGVRIGIAQSELTDPREQRRRLAEGVRRSGHGDHSGLAVDEAFLRSLEHAMPPTGGLRIDIDALVACVTGRAVADTVAFPFAHAIPHPLGGSTGRPTESHSQSKASAKAVRQNR